MDNVKKSSSIVGLIIYMTFFVVLFILGQIFLNANMNRLISQKNRILRNNKTEWENNKLLESRLEQLLSPEFNRALIIKHDLVQIRSEDIPIIKSALPEK